MIGVGENCACHVVRIEQLGSFVAVVDGEDEAAIEAASDFGDPVAGFEAGFRVLAILKGALLGRKILGDGAGRKRHGEFGETRAITSDKNFVERVRLLNDAVDRERVEKFVGKEAAGGNASGNFNRRAALPFLDEARKACCELVATRRRALDRNVAKGMIELRKFLMSKFEDLAGETADAGASFDEEEFG